MALNLNPLAESFIPENECNVDYKNNYNQKLTKNYELNFNHNDDILNFINDDTYWMPVALELIQRIKNRQNYDKVIKELKIKKRRQCIEKIKPKQLYFGEIIVYAY